MSSNGSVVLYEQAPLPLKVGQGVAVSGSQASLLPAACVKGTPDSTLDVMKESGATVLGITSMSSFGAVNGGPGLAASNGMSFMHNSFSSDVNPTITLAEVARFDDLLTYSDRRTVGLGEINSEHNAFFFDGDYTRTNASATDCGSLFVESFTAVRFLSIAFAIDFVTAADKTAFGSHDANVLLAPAPSTAAFLRDHGAKVSVHVLYPSGLADIVKKSISGDRCDEAHLEGCKPMFDHLYAVVSSFSTISGNDATAEEALAPGSTWGAYEASLGSYSMVIP